MRFRSVVVAVTLLAWSAMGSGAGAQSGADQTVMLGDGHGGAKGTLRMPASPARPPVVVWLPGDDAAGLMAEAAAALASEGVASLRLPGDLPTAEIVAQWVTFLRNDGRFPTVTVAARDQLHAGSMASAGRVTSLGAAVIAARAARADGVVTLGDTRAAAAEIARLVAKVGTATDVAGIAAFARSVPALGRRGAPNAARPTTARRSPRQTIIASVGSVRVGIEWGSPQMRGREVWGGLVKWDEIWMPGADEATTLTTNGPVTIGSIELPAGDYSIYTFPTADRLELIVSRDVGQFHTVKDESLFIGRVPMAVARRTESVEGLTFAIDATGAAGMLKLIWANREDAAPITTRDRLSHMKLTYVAGGL